MISFTIMYVISFHPIINILCVVDLFTLCSLLMLDLISWNGLVYKSWASSMILNCMRMTSGINRTLPIDSICDIVFSCLLIDRFISKFTVYPSVLAIFDCRVQNAVKFESAFKSDQYELLIYPYCYCFNILCLPFAYSFHKQGHNAKEFSSYFR
eukprot:457964_1